MVKPMKLGLWLPCLSLAACVGTPPSGRAQEGLDDASGSGSAGDEGEDTSAGMPGTGGDASSMTGDGDTEADTDDDTDSNGSDDEGTPACERIGSTDIDLASNDVDEGLIRVFGSNGDGSTGVPVAAGGDVDGDGNEDFAFSAMVGDVEVGGEARAAAGEVYLVFGSGGFDEELDSIVDSPRILKFAGGAAGEHAGSALWMDDVTGDGTADLIIARQDFDEIGRAGAGALTIVVGGSELATAAAALEPIDLAAPPDELTVVTFTGANAGDRLGVWMRTGDITGDGIPDLAIAADGEAVGISANAGVVYVVRGGTHLEASAQVDLAFFDDGAFNPLVGHVARVTAPAGIDASDYHFGGTVQIADLDANGRAELVSTAAFNRASGQLGGGAGVGANPDGGTVFIVGDANFPDQEVWDPVPDFAFDAAIAGSTTTITGGALDNVLTTVAFGEEVLGGLDYDGDGFSDLFVGDLVGDHGLLDRAGLGFVIWGTADGLLGQQFSIVEPPEGIEVSTLLGPEGGALAGDTAMHGDFDGDGIADLAISSPRANPRARLSAGTVHVLWGRDGRWPSTIDLNPNFQPGALQLAVTDIMGRNGTSGVNVGDTLSYSGAYGDIDGDGLTDLVTNEMQGDSLAGDDVGNLIVISGAYLSCPE